jgi:hypothetical protein
VHVEAGPGIVITVPDWMLKPVACNRMHLGSPHVALAVLSELSGLLRAVGFRSSSGHGLQAIRRHWRATPLDHERLTMGKTL